MFGNWNRRARVGTWLRRVAIGIGALALLAVISILAMVAWVHTDAGHRFVARHVESFVGSQIRGQLRIGTITDVSSDGLQARDVRFLAPNGEEVLVVDDVAIDLRWSALLSARFVVPSARVHGGRLMLHDPGNGSGLLFALAFANPLPGHGNSNGSTQRDGPPPIDIDNVQATALTLVANIHGAPGATATGLHALVHVWLPSPSASPRLEVRDLSGRLAVRTPAGVAMTITSGTIHFDGGARERAEIDLHGIVRDVAIRWVNRVVQQGAHPRVTSVLTVPNLEGAAHEIPTIAEGSMAELAASGFDFSVRIGPTTAHGASRAEHP